MLANGSSKWSNLLSNYKEGALAAMKGGGVAHGRRVEVGDVDWAAEMPHALVVVEQIVATVLPSSATSMEFEGARGVRGSNSKRISSRGMVSEGHRVILRQSSLATGMIEQVTQAESNGGGFDGQLPSKEGLSLVACGGGKMGLSFGAGDGRKDDGPAQLMGQAILR
ncbi:hypothetical protein COCNU_10G008550 [Cocos nucifera]|uniref:Uncharacterized protein n=1 Tax=Cocos nucifera TaxID=13894 RepID=A0A8K0N8P7_COCNU|nr:hypothetical protein COCNU_10G008550 [Cocos nucifera]